MCEPETKRTSQQEEHFHNLAELLASAGANFYQRGWALGTSGNFSAVVSREPLRLAITPTGAHKGELTREQIVEIDAAGKVVRGEGRASDEAGLHLAVVRLRRVGAVLHTHSVWSTIVSEKYAPEGGISIEGFEMLKGLAGVRSHEHREWLPILENSQDIHQLIRSTQEALEGFPAAHGFLLRRHGLYTWGEELSQAKRHVEILEFLLEVTGRTCCAEGKV